MIYEKLGDLNGRACYQYGNFFFNNNNNNVFICDLNTYKCNYNHQTLSSN